MKYKFCSNKGFYEQKYTHLLSVGFDGRNFILVRCKRSCSSMWCSL